MRGESLEVEFAAAHEEIAFRVGANIFTLLINELRTANGTVVPPVVWRVLSGERRCGSIFQWTSDCKIPGLFLGVT